jgi:DNA-binding response OmpR family regulator
MVCENEAWMPALEACRDCRRCAKPHDFSEVLQPRLFMKRDRNILIVEDDKPVAVMMVQMLSQAGCNVLAVHTGKRGMELVLENPFDLIVLDICLPDISGFDLCGEFRQRHVSRHTPIVFVSAHSSEEDKRRGLELGAVDHIAKPFNLSDFIQRILAPITRKASIAYMDNEAPTES